MTRSEFFFPAIFIFFSRKFGTGVQRQRGASPCTVPPVPRGDLHVLAAKERRGGRPGPRHPEVRLLHVLPGDGPPASACFAGTQRRYRGWPSLPAAKKRKLCFPLVLLLHRKRHKSEVCSTKQIENANLEGRLALMERELCYMRSFCKLSFMSTRICSPLVLVCLVGRDNKNLNKPNTGIQRKGKQRDHFSVEPNNTSSVRFYLLCERMWRMVIEEQSES